ncbi:hypothetical protein BGW80DRAFT_1324378 [Lactifluus volemus]|nr:hypothetical protein BGW80DRAFT_1355443 [Lactifluus volemus]KAH9971155.1 hypothetical protein BGW80DRAFT_1324378 [Lactifluus volemus]
MSEPSPDIENQADRNQSEPKSPDSDPRAANLKSVTDAINSKGKDESPRSSRSLLPTDVPVADSKREEGQQIRPHLGVKLTGYRLLNIVVLLAFCIRKGDVLLALTHCRQTVVSATPELVAGIFMAVLLYWFGRFESRLDWPLFFHVDLGPLILRLLRYEAHNIIRMLVPVEGLVSMRIFAIQPPTPRGSSWIIVVLFWISASVVCHLVFFTHAFVLWFLVDVWEAPQRLLFARVKHAARHAWFEDR